MVKCTDSEKFDMERPKITENCGKLRYSAQYISLEIHKNNFVKIFTKLSNWITSEIIWQFSDL